MSHSKNILNLVLAVCMAALASGCGERPIAEVKDIAAWVPGAPSNVYGLYYYENGNFMRALCPPNTALYDRGLCNKFIADVPADGISKGFRAILANDLPAADTKYGQLRTRLERIERRQIELVNLQPTPRDPNLLVDIRKKENERALVDADILGLRDQIARIEAELLIRFDQSLVSQLNLLQEQHIAKVATQNLMNTELGALRQLYLRANADLIDPSLYRELEAERVMVVREIGQAIAGREVQLSKMLAGDRLLARIMDGGYVYDFVGTNPAAADIGKVLVHFVSEFEKHDILTRTFQPRVDLANNKVTINVERQGFIGKMFCMLTTIPEAQCRNLELTSPYGTVYRTEVSVGVQLNYPRICDGEFCKIFTKEAQGVWQVKPICQMNMIGGSPIRAINDNWTCKIEVNRWSALDYF